MRGAQRAEKTNFTHVKPAFNHCVQLPNQTKIQVHFIGTVVLIPDIVLHNVYYVPHFKFNLHSVSSLLHDSNYSMTFTSNSYFIQDNRTLRMIGKGELVDGLYLIKNSPLTDVPSPVCQHTVSSVDSLILLVNTVTPSLWHARSGHPSNKSLIVLSDKLNMSSNKMCSLDSCTVCPLAKQCK